MTVTKQQLSRDARDWALAAHSNNEKRLQFKLAVIRSQIKLLRDAERRLADALAEWDRSPHAVPIHQSIKSLIDRSPTAY